MCSLCVVAHSSPCTPVRVSVWRCVKCAELLFFSYRFTNSFSSFDFNLPWKHKRKINFHNFFSTCFFLLRDVFTWRSFLCWASTHQLCGGGQLVRPLIMIPTCLSDYHHSLFMIAPYWLVRSGIVSIYWLVRPASRCVRPGLWTRTHTHTHTHTHTQRKWLKVDFKTN